MSIDFTPCLNVYAVGKLHVVPSVIQNISEKELGKLCSIAQRRKADTLVLKRNEIRYPMGYETTVDTPFGPVETVRCFTKKQRVHAKNKTTMFEAYDMKVLNEHQLETGRKFDIMI